MIDPDDFVRWIFPRLFRSRVPRYEKIATDLGYTLDAQDLFSVRDENEFLSLLESALN